MCDRSSSRREPPPTGSCRAGIVVPASPAVGVIAGSNRLPVRRDSRGWLSSQGVPLAVHHRVARKTLVHKPRHGRLPERHNPCTRAPGLPCARRSVRDSPRDLTPPGAATPFHNGLPAGHSSGCVELPATGCGACTHWGHESPGRVRPDNATKGGKCKPKADGSGFSTRMCQRGSCVAPPVCTEPTSCLRRRPLPGQVRWQ
jgi:hypothetical protein